MAGNREPLEKLLQEMVGGNLRAAIDRLKDRAQLSLPELAAKCCGFRLIRPSIPIRSRPRFRFQIAHRSDFKSPGGSGPSGTLIFWHW
jgi:hypothetical protein